MELIMYKVNYGTDITTNNYNKKEREYNF